MDYFTEIISVLSIITGIILILVSVHLIKTIKTNGDKTVESIKSKLDKNLTAIAVLTIMEAILCAVNIFTK